MLQIQQTSRQSIQYAKHKLIHKLFLNNATIKNQSQCATINRTEYSSEYDMDYQE